MDVAVRNTHASELLVYLYRLYQDKNLTDLQVVAADWKVYHVHKIVVTAASQYLHNLCCKQHCKGTVNLDVPGNLLNAVLEFCYTGQLFVPIGQWQNVYNLATMLQMYNLLELMNQTDVDNEMSTKTEPSPGAYKKTSALEDDIDMSQLETIANQLLQMENNDSYITVKTEVQETDTGYVKEIFPGPRDTHDVNKSTTRRKKSKLPIEHDPNYDTDTDPDYNPLRSEEEGNTLSSKNPVPSKIRTRSHSKIVDNTKKHNRKKSRQKTKLHDAELKTKKRSSKSLRGKKAKRERGKRVASRLESSHVKVNRNIKIYVPTGNKHKCAHCSKDFNSYSHYARHVSKCHTNAYAMKTRYLFLLKIASQSSLRNICMAVSEDGKMVYKCNICKRRLGKYCLMSLHCLRKHGKRYVTSQNWLKFHCRKVQMLDDSSKIAQNRKKLCQINEMFTSLKFIKSEMKTEKCSECHKMFKRKASLNAHLRNIHGLSKKPRLPSIVPAPQEPLFQCCQCQACMKSKTSLVSHLKTKHGYSASEANEKYSMLSHDLPCDVKACMFSTNHLTRMKEHVLEKHPFLKYQCQQCPKVFWVEWSLKRHMYKCHSQSRGSPKYRCSQCDKTFEKSGLMKKHEFWKHNIQHENIKVYYCEHEDCGYKTLASSALKLHQSKHRTEKLFTCEYCNTKLKTETIYKKHVRKIHLGIRPYLCQVCGQNFGEEHELKSHMNNRHPIEKSFKCEYSHLFNVHKVRADDDKRKEFKCPHCPFTSILHYRYQNHLNSHSGTRNFMCPICDKTFISANTLRSHNQWLHSDKVYSCSQCNYQTKTSQKLNEHIRVQHQLKGFKPYKCPYCNFRCATGGNTRKHVKQVHRGQPVTYIRDTDMIDAARKARASGYLMPMAGMLPNMMDGFTDQLDLHDHSLEIVL